MRILLSNDDGVHALGIKVLKNILQKDHDVYVVAPLEEKSATGHGLTLSDPIRAVEIEKHVWGVSGYPADCVLMGIQEIFKDIAFDVVISGINHGANMGQEIYYSGTLAAAREGSFHGLKSIAVSLVTDHGHRSPLYFETAAHFVSSFLKSHPLHLLQENQMFNINVPNILETEIKGVAATLLGFRIYDNGIEKRFDNFGRPYYWLAGKFQKALEIEDSDGMAIVQKKISVTLIDLLGRNASRNSELQQFVQESFAS